ncbi:MAG: isoprenyl transferase [Lachnospiraceae bacterium]|nr:isoprenyl transferase [Lachnospiraceae bacterium]
MAKISTQEFAAPGLDPSKLPSHVAIIMDGNGRWAQAKGMPRSFGHRAGVNRLREIIRFSSDASIKVLTLYAFSTENWSRPKDEVSTLMGLLVEYFRSEIAELHENHVRIRTIGDIGSMPPQVAAAIREAEEKTRNNNGLILNIALNYGGRAELLMALKELASLPPERIASLSERDISDHLYTAGLPDPDLIIRTAGEKRLSNFLLYQCAYSEFYFTDAFWPDFTKERYVDALRAFQARNRRFGGLSK